MIQHNVLILLILSSPAIRAQADPNALAPFVFSSAEQGRQLLGQTDAFVQQMSPFDRSARLKTDAPVTQAEYLAFVRDNVLNWTPDERSKLGPILQDLNRRLALYSLNLPETVVLIKTTGNEEGQAAYTRQNAIVLPQSQVTAPSEQLKTMIAHELFHIYTRANPEQREQLYAMIGFKPCSEIPYPDSLKPRKITNPDAPSHDFYIEVLHDGQAVRVVPILFSRTTMYDGRRGGEFFEYLEFRFLVLRQNEQGQCEALYKGHEPVLLKMQEVTGYFEKIGKNTNYVIHPEEILADNFSYMVTGRRNLPSAWVTEQMKALLAAPQ